MSNDSSTLTEKILPAAAAAIGAVCAATAPDAAAETDYAKAGANEFKLAPVFCDHMVLQQGVVIPVWGEGPNAAYRISVSIAGKTTWAHSENWHHIDGISTYRNTFRAYLPPMEAGGPYELIVSNEQSHAYVSIKDVYIGEVWLASGQSNMAFKMPQAKPGWDDKDIPLLRVYNGGWNKGAWKTCTPESVKGMTAVGTFFGRNIQEKLGCAVGILDLSCGGTLAENWTSRAGLMSNPVTRKFIEDYELGQSDPSRWEPTASVPKDTLDPGRDPKTADWAKPGIDISKWQKCDMPGSYKSVYKRAFNGSVWFRKDVDIPEAWAGKDLVLRLPKIDKHDISYFNDTEVGRTGKDLEWKCLDELRVYKVPGTLVKAGKNTIAVRIWSYAYASGFVSGETHFSIGPESGEEKSIRLGGEWFARIENDIGNAGDDISPKARTYPDANLFTQPSSWYRKMLEPVIPYPIKGAVWYQGCSNADSVEQARRYEETLKSMISDWRYQWGLGDFPVGIVMIANYMNGRYHEVESPWAELKDCQLRASRSIPNTGLICTMDLGDELNIHPLKKKPVGERLGRWALDRVYGKGDGKPYTAPRYLSGGIEGAGKVRFRFTEAEGGIIADGPVECCYVKDVDGNWHQGDVEIDGETIVVSCGKVAEPCEIRYAWAGFPLGATLKGKATGLQVFPFRWINK